MARFKLTAKNDNYPLKKGDEIFVTANSEWEITDAMVKQAAMDQLNKKLNFIYSTLTYDIKKLF